MREMTTTMISSVSSYCTDLLTTSKCKDLPFHNLHHTKEVVQNVNYLCAAMDINQEDTDLLIVAAWFHDSGHIIKYIGHEEESQKIAKEWLIKEQYPIEKINQVLACIAVTQLPQQPKNLLEQIICDSDLYHLSLGEYCHLQFQLREEFKRVFKKEYTDIKWMEENVGFVHKHQYFTDYGQSVLEKRKQRNESKCEQLLEEYQKSNKP